MKKLLKKIALIVPPINKIYIDLENRRRRVAELEGHIKVLKRQMAQALNHKNSATLNESTVASDIKHLKLENDKLIKKHADLIEKYNTLYRDFCVTSMSNEALLKTNEALISGDLFTSKVLKKEKSNLIEKQGSRPSRVATSKMKHSTTSQSVSVMKKSRK